MPKRDKQGRFVKGHSGNPGGRPRRAQEEEIKAALEKAVPESTVLAQLAAAIQRRESWAISLYLAYKWGQPVKRQEVSGEDGGPILITSVEFVGLEDEP